ncbi:VOC family protein [Streptosporangium roseum]|uniref:Glyoxalase/bleomycin resistance protein/dioxygenase n=1 Tax=Streptosporangium roseum (strain ATCC 12428 / DSM 43021 / JCM 3005 / KCTC 9067 / NCIMB 10171 / NRRL 2505 / NI 9100) TaxID=479432 RepID=D2B6X9_STRRD|nr:VOC family protein [Streptosporangium roseum]ACZ87717.1 glyoxalase/bleomycin resistance protein/dioxygenase [Streptosporangium roseum DSM 43021]
MKAAPERYRYAAIPHLMVEGAAEAIRFYAEAFGGEELFRIADPEGRIAHAEVSIKGSIVMVGDADGPFKAPGAASGSTVGLHVYVDDVDTLSDQAVRAGAELLQPSTDMFYGARSAMLRDPFGHLWVFLTHTEDLSSKEIARRGTELLRGGSLLPG